MDFERDEFFRSFRTEEHEEFKKFILGVDADSSWEVFPLSEIRFDPADKFLVQDLYTGSEDALADSKAGSLPIVATLPGEKVVCVRQYLWKQIKQLHKMTAPILTDILSSGALNVATELVNACGPYLKNSVQVLLRGGKVTSYASKYNANWTESEQISYLEEAFSRRFPLCRFQGGSFTHAMTTAEYAIGESMRTVEEDASVLAAYAQSWVDAGLDGDLREAIPVIRFVTGESGLTSILVKPFFLLGGSEIPVSPALSVTHRGPDELVWGKFKDFPTQSMSMFKMGMDKLKELCERQVYHPYACMTHVLKPFVGLLNGTTLDGIAESFKVFYDPEDSAATCKGIDIYMQVNEAIRDVSDSLSATKRLQAQELVSMMLVADWDKLDVAKAIRLRSCKAKSEVDAMFED